MSAQLAGLRCQNVALSDDYVRQGRVALFLVHRCVSGGNGVLEGGPWAPSGTGVSLDQPWIVAGAVDGEMITYGIPIKLPPDPDPENATNLHIVWEGCYGDAVFVGPRKFVVVWHRNYGERFMTVGRITSDLTITLEPEQALQRWQPNPLVTNILRDPVNHGTTTNTGTNTLTISVPSTVVDGDTLILGAITFGGGPDNDVYASISPGWSADIPARYSLWHKVWYTGDPMSATLTFTPGGFGFPVTESSAVMFAVSNLGSFTGSYQDQYGGSVPTSNPGRIDMGATSVTANPEFVLVFGSVQSHPNGPLTPEAPLSHAVQVATANTRIIGAWALTDGSPTAFTGVGSAADSDITSKSAWGLSFFLEYDTTTSKFMAFGAQHLVMVTEDVGVAIWGFSDYWSGGNDRFRARAFRVNEHDITMGQVFEVPQTDNTPHFGVGFLPGPLMNLFKMGDGRVVFAGGRPMIGPTIPDGSVWERYLIAIRVDVNGLTLSFGNQDITQKCSYAAKLNDEYMFAVDNITDTREYDYYSVSYGSLIKIHDDDSFAEIASIPLGRFMYSIFPFGENLVGVGEGADLIVQPHQEMPQEVDGQGVNPGFAVHMVDVDLTKGTLTKWQTPFYHEGGSQLSSQSRKSVPFGDDRRTLVPGTAGAKAYVFVKPQIRQANQHVQRSVTVQRKARKHE